MAKKSKVVVVETTATVIEDSVLAIVPARPSTTALMADFPVSAQQMVEMAEAVKRDPNAFRDWVASYQGPINRHVVQAVLSSWASQQDPRLAELILDLNRWIVKAFPNQPMPGMIIAIEPFKNLKALGYCIVDGGYGLPAIKLNKTYVDYNYFPLESNIPGNIVRTSVFKTVDDSGQAVEYLDPHTVIGHTLRHETIHYYLMIIKGERYKNEQEAHGGNFKKEMERLDLPGAGRLMANPYPVRWSGNGADYWAIQNAKVTGQPVPKSNKAKAMTKADKEDYIEQYAVAFKDGVISREQLSEAVKALLDGHLPPFDTNGQEV